MVLVVFWKWCGGSLNPTSIETVNGNRHNIIQDKTVFKYAVTTYLMLVN
jgi:hypothetical protein